MSVEYRTQVRGQRVSSRANETFYVIFPPEYRTQGRNLRNRIHIEARHTRRWNTRRRALADQRKLIRPIHVY